MNRDCASQRALSTSRTKPCAPVRQTRQALSNLLNEHAALSAEMALRIEKAFGPRMEHFMRMQYAYDVAQARLRQGEIRVKRYGVQAARK